MHEPDIAPLARRLAEENNVDWRRLSGTGEGGRVVERDVLGYLARVMAGDEAVDPTPEPVPDGMAAWPEGDVAAYRKGADVEDEPDTRATLDDDLFLFDDPLPGGGAQAGLSGHHDDALFVSTDDGEPGDAEAIDAARDGHVVEEASSDEGEDGVWLVGDDASEADRAEDADDGAEADDEADADLADDEAAVGATQPVWAAPGESEEASDELRLDELPDLTEGDAGTGASHDEDEVGRGAGGRGAFMLPDLFADDGGPDDAEREVPLERDDAVPEAVPADAAAVAVPSIEAAPGVHWARHGQLWRRRFDSRALRQAASDAAAALDVPPTTVVALLLARAASRAGVATGPVDVWRWRRSGADRTGVDLDASVRDAIHGIETRAEEHAGAQAVSLVVADLGDLDVDEAVLHLEVPVLALGRSGADGSWLSLSGDELDGGAASGLARVADLLGAPVRLLV